MSKPVLNTLIELTEQNNPTAIKSLLESLPQQEKGKVFEQYLAKLYEGNGWQCRTMGGRSDKGADLLLYHPKEPERVSLIIQAKNHNKPLSYDDTRIELIKFLEQGASKYNCQQFRIISINAYVEQAKKLREFNLLLDSWDYVKKLIKNYNPHIKQDPFIELYAHNQITYEKIKELWKANNYVAVVQATGTGKSYLIAKVIADYIDRNSLIMAPTHTIIDQQKSKIPWAYHNSTFMTYAKSPNLTQKLVTTLNPELIILDEYHRCGAQVWGSGVKQILDAHPDALILGTTATPIRYLDGKRDMSDELFQGSVAVDLSLAKAIIKKILPTPVYVSALYTLKEEAEKLLASLETSKKAKEEKTAIAQEIKATQFQWERTSGIPEVLKEHLPAELNKIIVFCESKEHLDHMELEVQKWFLKLKRHKYRKTYRVLSEEPESAGNLDAFRNAKDKKSVHLLFAIDMLNEGLHVKDVGAVILLRKTESPTVFFQQIGRCIEVDSRHTPLIFDFVNNFKNIRANDLIKDLDKAGKEENAIRNSFGLPAVDIDLHLFDKTKEICEVFKKIEARLKPWEVGFQYLEEFVEEFGHALVLTNYKSKDGFNLGPWVSHRRQDYKKENLTKEKIVLLEALPGWSWDPSEDRFQEMYQHLIEFVKKEEHAFVPDGYKTKNGDNLGSWVQNKRQEYKQENLSKKDIELLESVSGWSWDIFEDQFQVGIQYLKLFIEKKGHALVPRNHKTKDGFNLGIWVNSKRKDFNTDKLSKEKIELLESFLDWSWDPLEDQFQEGIRCLKQYIEKEGNALVPKNYKVEDGFNLGSWVQNKRTHYKNEKLSKEKIELLESFPGWSWDSLEAKFQKGIRYLKQFIEKEGHALVPKRHLTENGVNLGGWVLNRRKDYKKGKLSKEKIKLLQSISGWTWDPLDEEFQKMFRHLIEFIKIEEHAFVPDGYKTENGDNLGNWVQSRRKDYKKGELSKKNIELLESVSGWSWDLLEDQFQEMFRHLIEYEKKEGHALVPKRHLTENGVILGSWVTRRRRDYKKDKLTKDKIELLESVPGWSWDPLEDQFQEVIQHLKDFIGKVGHTLVPKNYKTEDGINLGSWIGNKRTNYKKGKLSKEKIVLLESLPGWSWDPYADQFRKGLRHLKQFTEKEGHALIPQNYRTENEFKLGNWVSDRRKDYKKGKLSKEKIKLLESVPSWQWSTMKSAN